MGKLQDRVGASGVDNYLSALRQRESNNNYQQGGNQYGFIGAYQFGAPALEDLGYLKKGASKLGNAALADDNNWTIPGGRAAFLANKSMQDSAATNLADRNISTLERAGKIDANSEPGHVAGMAGAAHGVGATGVINYGLARTDGNGVPASQAYQVMRGGVEGKKDVEVPEDAMAGKLGKGKPGQTERSAASAGKNNAPGENKSTTAPFTGNGVAIKKTGVPDKVSISASRSVEAIPLPVANPLTQFSSFNAIMTFSSLSSDQYNFPEKSYKAGDIGRVVLRSAGAGANAQSTAFTSSFNLKGQYDFQIDNLELKSLMTFTEETKGSNVNIVNFDVYEPYSMGIFLQAAQQAADDNGHGGTGYMGSPFLITIEFVGWDNSGKSILIPNTTRHIPVHITNIDMTVKASGCVYNVQCLASNELALTDDTNLFKTDIAISGSTVQEILQTGEFSLQTVLNKRLQEYAAKENEKTAFDEIVIVFPKDVVESTVPQKEAEGSAKKDTKVPPKTVVLNSALSVSRAPGALLKQEKETLNYLGASSMGFDKGQAGEPQIIKLDNAHTDSSKPAQRDKITFNTSTRQFMFSQGTTIVNAISKVISQCKHCKDVVDKKQLDDKGMIDWFRIETQIILQPAQSGNKGKSYQPKLIIFKVVPYKTSGAALLSPNAEPVGLDALKQEVAKIYDYMYTGKNTEILDFDISYKGAFFSTAPADQTKANAAAGTSMQQSQTGSDTAPTTPNSSPGQHERATGRQQPGYSTSRASPDDGGTEATDNKTIAAQNFQKSLYNNSISLVNVTMKILGDPYYLADSGLGNFSNSGTGRFNLTKSGAMDYQSGDVDILLNFRTPLDYNASTGIMDFGNSKLVSQFSGLYQVLLVTHKFNKGKYTQELKMQRRMNQQPVPDEDIKQTTAPGKTKSKYTGNKVIDLSNSAKYSDGTPRNSAAGVDSATANPNGILDKISVSNTSNVLPVPGVVPAGPGQKFGSGTGLFGR